jgi:hypothetical protein
MARLSTSVLESLQPLLDELQDVPGLVQIKPAIFYSRRIPMLHFHETADGVVADLKCVTPIPSGFDRMKITSASDRQKLIKAVTARCAALTARHSVKRT